MHRSRPVHDGGLCGTYSMGLRVSVPSPTTSPLPLFGCFLSPTHLLCSFRTALWTQICSKTAVGRHQKGVHQSRVYPIGVSVSTYRDAHRRQL